MRRRDFIAGIAGLSAAWPLAARGQSGKSPVRIGFVFFGSPSNLYDQSLVKAFQEGLRQVGLIENQDIVLDVVWISGDPEKAVTEVLGRGAELLVPSGSGASVAAMHQTSTLPIVFINVGDPIAMGLVDSLPRPGRNATGFSDILAELSGKFVDLARELSKPGATVGYLWHTAWPDGRNRYQLTEQAALTAGVKLRSRGIVEIAEIGDAIAEMKQSRVSTLIVQPSPFTYQQRDQIIDAATNNSLATILAWPVAAREGGLIGYGPNYLHTYRRAPFYVDRILKGAKPADLPVERPTKVEFFINLKTAKVLGLELPLSLLIRADELIE
jgi:putative tryptophan/tyrosine transport system substrate-binding protein